MPRFPHHDSHRRAQTCDYGLDVTGRAPRSIGGGPRRTMDLLRKDSRAIGRSLLDRCPHSRIESATNVFHMLKNYFRS